MANNKFCGMEKLSLVDYEGKLACTLFTEGCNFRCPFCHNGPLVLDCNNFYLEDEEILDYLTKRKKHLDAVVITGGEPTLLIGLDQKLRKIKQLGYLIKLDTNGSNYEVLKKLIDEKLIDYVAMDIKNSFEKYLVTIDITNINILNNVKKSINLLMSNVIDYEFRTTLVEEFHSKEDINEIGKMIKGAKRIYLQKFVDREGCIKKGLHEVQIKNALEFKCILENYLQNVYLRGY